MKKATEVILFFLLFLHVTNSFSQILTPVKINSSVKDLGNGEYQLIFEAKIEDGWHLYSHFVPEGGPIPASVNFENRKGFQIGKFSEEGEKIQKNEPLFGMDLVWYEGKAVFKQKIKVNSATANVKGYFEYGICNDRSCLPPSDVEFDYKLKGVVLSKSDSGKTAIAVPETSKIKEVNVDIKGTTAASVADTSQKISSVISTTGKQVNINPIGWWKIFIGGFGGGLLALLTPCVFPMIPLTVSFFTKKNHNRKKAIIGALTYAFSIIIIYVALGFIVTKLLGSDALNQLASNGIFNVTFFIIFVIFAISFFGAFEITLPSAWVNRSETMSDREGMIGIFFMAFTLALVSFSCTGPIIGTLLVQAAVGGNSAGPLLGMAGFAIALALPFGLFAMFPGWLKSLPRSGGWLNTVKVTLGFLELALALKFLSNVDLAYHWGILDREVFLVLWITIFSMLGFYLLGYIRFAHDTEMSHVSISRLFASLLCFAFSIYMLPGLWGHPLLAISAFAPPQSTLDFDLSKLVEAQDNSQVSLQSDEKKQYSSIFHCPHGIDCYFDYDEGLSAARAMNKPVMLDFTGWSCVNCRKMETSVWSNPEVLQRLKNDYVLISMYVDDKTALPDSSQYISPFSGKKIKTLGNKYSDVQATQFGTNSQPYYVLVDPFIIQKAPPMLLNQPRAFDLDVKSYINFLDKGLHDFKLRRNS
ncbi:MAG: thioredoxin family protein [Chitinophagales bacterium]|nr:thioredoxin family protein [Chitinophagales bacterium]